MPPACPTSPPAPAAAQKWQLAILGSAPVGGGTAWASSQLTGLEIVAPFLTGKLETALIEPGQKGRVVCKLEQQTPFTGKATAKLMGLPDKVTAKDVQISSDDKEIAFDVAVEAGCTARSTRVLFCSVVIQKDGEPITHSIANGGTLRIVPAKKTADAGDAKKVAVNQPK